MNRSNLELAEQLYNSYTQNPQSVDREWQIFFEGMEFAGSSNLSSSRAQGVSEKEVDVYRLIRAYRDYGHLKANLDPLGLNKRDHSFLNLENFGLSEKDFNQSFRASSFLDKENMTLKEILQKLETTYCGTLTAQLAECEPNVRLWFYKELENNGLILPQDQKQKIYEQLARTESLEKFIHTRFVGMKRFSIEGGDSLIPMLEHLVEKGTSLKVEEVVIGMAHRGRINVLANFMDKGLEDILSEFEGHMPHSDKYEGDVKYHLGYSSDKETQSGPCHLSLAFNPSHLEAVSPVVLGMTRAKQRVRKDTKERKKVVPVLIHGDAAFSGQGVVTET
ncbi:MAG: 2-oxoglutarate dehydrogenase subunit E1, partial [Bdellovibrionales bacterium]|nr:2-oxoglutarate dehydrogenase subunit E1 [Bdellovibrionales bacterium]